MSSYPIPNDMRLKQLKLAGFKSFVEPTVIPFPSQLVAIVGPNGCGKSNIIDAVRWVMGERSAKTLRGESMADVIFNGSSNRKSVGQAFVELIFDNHLGRLGGQYASYQEVAIKRMVTRDGDSAYFLNGVRCRRRDISDVFLGTGTGARGYAIIGQDMISKIIEARPEELRTYLEEAAGISKYKERRRETVQRIGQTRENLERVDDVRQELGKQLVRLERQASTAKRYRLLKTKERSLNAEILALQWRALTSKHTLIQQELSRLTLQYEAHQAQRTHSLKESHVLREKLHCSRDDLQLKQERYYQLSTEIARLEEVLQQQVKDKQRLLAEQQQAINDSQNVAKRLEQYVKQLSLSQDAYKQSQTTLNTLNITFAERQCLLQKQTQLESEWSACWQQKDAAYMQAKSDKDIVFVRMQHLEFRQHELLLRIEKLTNDVSINTIEGLQLELSTIEKEKEFLTKQHLDQVSNYQQYIDGIRVLGEELNTLEMQLHQAQDNQKKCASEYAALKAAQDTSLQIVNQAIGEPYWKEPLLLIDVIKVPKKWLKAVELVLGDSLQAIVIEMLDEIWPQLESLNERSALFISAVPPTSNTLAFPRLIDHLGGLMPKGWLALETIFIADTLDEARAMLPSLNRHQSVVTADGCWLGEGWLRTAGSPAPNTQGLLARQQTMSVLHDQLVGVEQQLTMLRSTRDGVFTALMQSNKNEVMLKQRVSAAQTQRLTCEAAVSKKQHALEHALTHHQTLTQELESLHASLETLVGEKVELESKMQLLIETFDVFDSQKKQMQEERAQWQTLITTTRQEVESLRSHVHQIEIQCNREALIVQQVQDNIFQQQENSKRLNAGLNLIEQQLNEREAPDNKKITQLNRILQERLVLEDILRDGREHLSKIEIQLNGLELCCKDEELLAQQLQATLSQQKLEEQALSIRAHNLAESLSELGYNPEQIHLGIQPPNNLEALQHELLDIQAKIKQLGAINLLAIEEYDVESQRKMHLDDQCQDLSDALVTLEAAITKMDDETRARMQDTFEQLNLAFKSLFPRLFGGGRAQLELTCDNLLEAGIQVMAQPPGKRNSSLHMLSGGEKAMTAVALVFALFQLNPSPFCMLDEVDAPLDDVNVNRFCDLVKEMSHVVQFLFITHNKVTMELADHLIGVTMREPGVSRVVTVDVEQALSIPLIFQNSGF